MNCPTFLAISAAFCVGACSTAPRERTATITAKPNFKEHSGYRTFEANGPEGQRSIFWPDTAPKPNHLDRDRLYTLDLLEEEWEPFGIKSDQTFWRQELVKMREGEKPLYDASVCRKHQTQMDRRLVKILYGLPSFTPEWKALRENAPNDGTVLGGCTVDSDRPETRTWVCPVCKSIRDQSLARMSRAKQ
jgi:hypothetical protein